MLKLSLANSIPRFICRQNQNHLNSKSSVNFQWAFEQIFNKYSRYKGKVFQGSLAFKSDQNSHKNQLGILGIHPFILRIRAQFLIQI